MEIFGISGVAFKWINRYLENKKQFVSFDKCTSDMRDILRGVPPVSILAPNHVFYVLMICVTYLV